MSQKIDLANLQVQVVDNSSGIFCGKNLQVSWNSISKYNMGSGIIGGDHNALPNSLNYLNDTDVLDSNINLDKNLAKNPDQH